MARSPRSSGPDVKPTEAEPAPIHHASGHRDRLRARLLSNGGDSLQPYEALELVLCGFIPRRDVKPIAKALIARFGGVSAALAASPLELAKVKGVGEVTAAYLKAIHVLHTHAAFEEVAAGPVISSWAALLNYVRLKLQHETHEQARAIFLDRKNKLISDDLMGTGTVDQAPVYPREVARRALERAASAVILVHNHPTGDPNPSRADIDMTREVVAALKPLDIALHDHLVVGRNGVFSFKAKGLI